MACPRLRTIADSRTYLTLVLIAALLPTLAGCQQESTAVAAAGDAKGDPSVKPSETSADTLLRRLAKSYRDAKSYEDAGVLRVAAEDQAGQEQNSPPMPFSVALERPNRVRIHSLQASIVDDGKKLYGSSDGLPNEVLVQPSPEPLSVDKLFADELLSQSASGQLNVAMPQLTLLLDEKAIDKLAGDGKPEMIGHADFDGIKCDRVKVKGKDGAAVFWISTKDQTLVKFEFPCDEIAKQYRENYGIAKFSMWAEFKGASMNKPIDAEAFAFTVPEGAKLLTKLLPPPPQGPSPLLGKKPDAFSFVNFEGGAVNSDSFAGKVVVLDMWATWCGWCFEGFPNLEKVYGKFKDNDKVVILAVNQDDPSVSDAKVQESFTSKNLTIPIVRDTQQVGDKTLQVQGLPTMVILGPDGKIEGYHVGYDAQLAQTLPPKIESLLAGKSLAQEELDKYEAELKKYDDELKKYEVQPSP